MTHAFDAFPYIRMNGIGNEILILDLRGTGLAMTLPIARAVGKGAGLHFDQMMVLNTPQTAHTDAYVTIHNIDGSLAAACGNGTRCVAWWLMRSGARRELLLETGAGMLTCTRKNETEFSVDMGKPMTGWADIPLSAPANDTNAVDLQVEGGPASGLPHPSCLSMGNPHAVFFVGDAQAWDLGLIGPLLEHHPMFPQKANISLASITAPGKILLRVWERGAGLTRACGSAACAATVAAARTGRTGRSASVSLPGGDLEIEWRADDHVIMTGAVEFEHEGRLGAELFAELAA